MNKKSFKFWKSFVGTWLIAGLFLLTIAGLLPNKAQAATLLNMSDTLSTQKASTVANHTIVFRTPTGAAENTDTITLTFSADFTMNSVAFGDFDLAHSAGSQSDCAAPTYTNEETLAASASDTEWGAALSGQVITFTAPTDGVGAAAIATNACVQIQIGTNATAGATGDTQITNGAADDDDTVAIAGTFGDSGTITVDIIDDDQVSVSATVNQSVTFDIDVGTAGNENTDTPYDVALGTITVTDTRVSGATDSVNRIMMDLDTNATSGATVTVRNTNGANGLVSTAVGADNIGSADGAIADGTENYGLCVISVTQTTGTLSKASPYNSGSCAADTETNDIQGLTTTGENIVTSTAPLAGGRAQVAVNAAISGVTVAHSDYTDTLTFIATANF